MSARDVDVHVGSRNYLILRGVDPYRDFLNDPAGPWALSFHGIEEISGLRKKLLQIDALKEPVLVTVHGTLMNYMISFALPRFTDQTLGRSRKRSLYPENTPDWVAKLDTVVHELYHIDPEQNCLRRFTRADGTESDALHNASYFEDVAALVQQYLASSPDERLLEFLKYDFEALRARYGTVAGTAFRSFPSYPRRYREAVDGPALPADIQDAPDARVVDTSPRVFSARPLNVRALTGTTSRQIDHDTADVAA